MATGRAYGAKEFGVLIGIQDQSEDGSNIGSAPDAAGEIINKVQMGLSTINDIAFDAGYQRSELSRAGRRAMRAEDVINHYGSGSWTFDFDWVCDNEVGLQNLLNLIYPETATTAASASGIVIPGAPTTTSMKHGMDGTVNTCGCVIIQNPETTEDRFMHSAVLQNLTLSMAAGTNSGALNASGQFYTGYKPVIAANTYTADSSASDFQKGLFDCTTHTLGGTDVSVSAFSVTISNPATRVGYQGSSGEADGYVRASDISVTGSITVKADSGTMGKIDAWQANTTQAIALTAGTATELDIQIPAANMSGHNMTLADDGTMIEIPFTATTGADGSGNLINIKAT